MNQLIERVFRFRSVLRIVWALSCFIFCALRGGLFLYAQAPGEVDRESTRQTLTLPPANSARAETQADEYEYIIGREDVLDIGVLEASELNRTVRVNVRGEISFPPLGLVKVEGLTAEQAEKTLQKLLRGTYLKDPHVSVYVKEIMSRPVIVMGMVAKPGVIQLRSPRSLIEVLAAVGGPMGGAGDSVLVIRNHGSPEGASGADQKEKLGSGMGGSAEPQAEEPEKSEMIKVNLKDLLESGNPAYNIAVYPGDIVTLQEPLAIFVLGDVPKPGAFPFKSGETMLQLLALAGGPGATANKKKARIIRYDPTAGKRVEIPFNVDEILTVRSPGPELRPNDIVFVPSNFTRRVTERAGSIALGSIPGIVTAVIVTQRQNRP